MKKVMLAMLIGFFSLAAIAQTKETDKEKNEKKVDVPDGVKSAFKKDYPSIAKASWGFEDGSYEAEFKVSGVDASATYTKAGHRLAYEIAIKVNELPASALEYVHKNYAAYKLTEAAKITDDKNAVTYEAEVGKDGKTWDVIFDANGKFVKQELGD